MKRNEIKKLIEGALRATLDEGVYDKGALKCFIMAGGPGSGKSYVVNNIFGMSPYSQLNTLTGRGLKIWNTDQSYTLALKKAGVDPRNLDVMAPKVVNYYMTKFRGKATAPVRRYLDLLKSGRVGIIIDGTAKDPGKVSVQKKDFEQAGYDVYMLFVSTPLDVAQKRNKMRDRALPEATVEKLWKQADANRDKYKAMFGGDFVEIDNSDPNAAFKAVQRKIDGLLAKPVKNPIGKEWIAVELDAKNRLKDMPKKQPMGESRSIRTLREAYLGQLRDRIEVVVNIDKTDHAGERQLRHGDADVIGEKEIMATANKAIDKVAKALMFDDVNIDEPIHIHDNASDLNLVCQIKQAGDKLKLVVITVMRKANFYPKSGTYSITV